MLTRRYCMSIKQSLVEGGGTYYHLNHSELEREEYERRGALLEKRETELKKLKVLIRDLEDYIDTLLVRIMEQTPTLLQVRSMMK
uniref:FIP-RBD domain-containing protein n=1 Tax=Sinocyclocheilus anshuiensis TaxID=1608454 RepID=A0A671NFT1_9TELE